MLRYFVTLIMLTAIIATNAVTPTDYSFIDCAGSSKPYPAPSKKTTYPDSLAPIMINHVGRHGARYPASSKNTYTLRSALVSAKEAGTLTSLGEDLLALTDRILETSSGQWGSLDSLGIAEQRGIAARMYAAFPGLFKNGRVRAISSYVPRCVMSMDQFTYQLVNLNDNVDISMTSGRQNSELLRFFETNPLYNHIVKSDAITRPYNEYLKSTVTPTALQRVLGKNFPYSSIDVDAVAMAEYSVIAGTYAMEMNIDASHYFTSDEYNALWSAFNLRQYLEHTATSVSQIPADIAAPLLENIIATTDSLVEGLDIAPVQLRFGHAETLMPLLSLMRLPDCYYLTNRFDTVGMHWKDFYVVPMASNLQFLLFKSKKTGRVYVRLDFNEVPVAFIPDSEELYIPWNTAREYLQSCLPS